MISLKKGTDSADWILVDAIKLEFKSGMLTRYGVNALVNLCNRRGDNHVKLALSDDGAVTQLEFFVHK